MSERVEIAIVGAGPAGLAAGVAAARRQVPHVVLERSCLADTIVRYQKGKWVMDEPTRLPLHAALPLRFQAAAREQVLEGWRADVESAGVRVLQGPEWELVGIEGTRGRFTLRLRGGERLEAGHVVLSIGVQGNLRRFGVPGDDLPHVTYQLDDPAAHVGRRIVVVGVGDAGIENALALVESDNEVTLVNRGAEIDRAKARNRTLAEQAIQAGRLAYFTNTVVERFEPGAVVLRTDDGEVRLEADLVIGRLGAIPPRRFLEEIGIQLPSADATAVPEVSDTYESNLPGIHLIGALAGYPLIKNCMNQGHEVVEHILGHPVTPADEPLFVEKFRGLPGSVSEVLERVRRTLPFFAGLTPIQLREFLFDAEVRRPRAGDVVFQRNDYSDTFFAILEGTVEVSVPVSDAAAASDRPDQELEERRIQLGPGRFFGEGSLVSGRRRSATVTAQGDCILIEAPRLATNKLIKSVEEVRRVVDATFAERVLENLIPEVDAAARAALAATAAVRVYRPGETLFEEGDDPDGLHLVRRGAVTVSKQIGGRETVLQYVQAGEVVGELALLSPGGRRRATVRATVLTETIVLPTAEIVPFMERHPELRRLLEEKRLEVARSDPQLALGREANDLLDFFLGTGATEATDMLVIDESLCIRCDNCEKACSATHGGVSRLDREAGPTFATTFATVHIPSACRHCENPKCMEDCPPDALRRHPTGEVYIMDNCIGCGNCASNCPYDVIQMAPLGEAEPPGLLRSLLFGTRPKPAADDEPGPHQVAVKCDLCVKLPQNRRAEEASQRREASLASPHWAACVSACPTGAILRVDPRRYVDEILGKPG